MDRVLSRRTREKWVEVEVVVVVVAVVRRQKRTLVAKK
jgi:hypothetical protein